MGVVTAADEYVSDAKKDMSSAIDSLHRVVVEHCWGWDDFTDEAKQRFQDVYFELIKLRNCL